MFVNTFRLIKKLIFMNENIAVFIHEMFAGPIIADCKIFICFDEVRSGSGKLFQELDILQGFPASFDIFVLLRHYPEMLQRPASFP